MRAPLRAPSTDGVSPPAQANRVVATWRPSRMSTTTAITSRCTRRPVASGWRKRSTRTSPPTIRLDGDADLGEPRLCLEPRSFDGGRYGGGVLRSHDEPKGAQRIAAVD